MVRADAKPNIGALWDRVDAERQRAARAAAIADSNETETWNTSPRPLRMRMATLYRELEARHLASARLHAMHALRLQRWLDGGGPAGRPGFMATVATALGASGATLTLVGRENQELLVAASGPWARAAHEIELVLAEGPCRDALTTGDTVSVAGSAIRDRWPTYGPAVNDLDVRTVVAVPLRLPRTCLGTLCAYDLLATGTAGLRETTGTFAEVLIHSLVRADWHTLFDGSDTGVEVFRDSDQLAVVHQVAGMLSVRHAMPVEDAIALLRARAFADDVPVDVVARRVADGALDLP